MEEIKIKRNRRRGMWVAHRFNKHDRNKNKKK
jgi:hypothetical protein